MIAGEKEQRIVALTAQMSAARLRETMLERRSGHHATCTIPVQICAESYLTCSVPAVQKAPHGHICQPSLSQPGTQPEMSFCITGTWPGTSCSICMMQRLWPRCCHPYRNNSTLWNDSITAIHQSSPGVLLSSSMMLFVPSHFVKCLPQHHAT